MGVTMKSSNVFASVSAIALFVAGAGLAATPAAAQTGPAAGAAQSVIHFDIPAGPLALALDRFAEVTAVQLVYPASLAKGLSSPGVAGNYSPAEALQRLVAGTGLTAQMLSSTSATLEPPPLGGAHTLGAVQVEGVQSDAFPALNGFGAGAGSNGSSDVTATEGTGSLTTNGASVASKTPQSLKDTPQSVTVITAERIQEQNLTDLMSALNYAPGVTLVQSNNSLQSTFYSRGFQITTAQIDGGAPLDLATFGSYQTTPNLAEYDNVQVLRGSDALFGGAGQPGGVVNLDRKRPLDHEQIIADASAGSWNNYQAQADVTGPIGFDGHVRARLVVSDQDRDFFYDAAHQNKAFIYGVVEGDLGPNTVARAGFSYEQQNNAGFIFGGLPRYSDGGDLALPRSTNFNPSWTRWNLATPEFFASLEHRFNSGWGLKVNVTRLAQESTETLGVINGFVYRDSPSLSNFGLVQGEISKFDSVQYALDATVNGKFELFGREQAVTAGVDYALSNSSNKSYASSAGLVPIDVFNFDRNSLNPAPQNPPLNSSEPVDRQEQWGSYFTMNFQPINNLHLIGGFRVSNYWYDVDIHDFFGNPSPIFSTHGVNDQTGIVTPYGSATFGLSPDLTIYASYADIFQSQGNVLDPAGRILPPVTGATYEAGIKGAFKGGKINASLSLYYTDEANQAVIYPGTCQVGSFCEVDSGAVVSKGVDLELSGELLPGWQFQGGYTYNANEYNKAFLDEGMGNGINASYQTQQPAHQVKLWTSYNPAGTFNRWTVGGGLRLESARYTAGSTCSVQLDPTTGACPGNVYVPFAFVQGLYTVVDLRAAYRFSSHWQAALDITNVGDTRYYATAGQSTQGNFYGEPRAFMFSVRANY
jgi:outer membrane receptor for ferric coprogen and ferric-rhodotorulic acid